jgi:uncharacterized membrane protein
MVEIKAADPWRGAAWLIEGFAYFTRSPVVWIVPLVIMLIINLALAFLPIFGTLAMQILSTVIIGGLILGCKEIDNGKELEIGHLFAGFNKDFGDLVVVGLLYLLGTVFIFMSMALVTFFTIGMDFISNLINSDISDINDILMQIYTTEFLIKILLIILVGLFFSVPLLMAFWFAPALVVLGRQKPIESMRNSFVGCLKNILPFLIYGVVGLILGFLASIPLFLGWIILTPMIIASIYLAYLDIYASTEPVTISQG